MAGTAHTFLTMNPRPKGDVMLIVIRRLSMVAVLLADRLSLALGRDVAPMWPPR